MSLWIHGAVTVACVSVIGVMYNASLTNRCSFQFPLPLVVDPARLSLLDPPPRTPIPGTPTADSDQSTSSKAG